MDTAPEETPGTAGNAGTSTSTDTSTDTATDTSTDTATDTATDTDTATSADTATKTEQPTQPPSGSAGPAGEQRLHRGGRGRMLAGVAAGLADYFDVDPTLVRIGFVALAFLGGLAVPLYLAGWLLIPDEDTDLSVAEELLARERAHGAL